MKRECGVVDRRNEKGIYNDMILVDRRWWMCCDWGDTQLPTWRRRGMHLKNDMSLEHVLLHGHDVLALVLLQCLTERGERNEGARVPPRAAQHAHGDALAAPEARADVPKAARA